MPAVQSDILLEEIERLLKEGKEVIFTPRGVSMRPFIEGGVDSVTLIKKHTIAVGDIVLAHIADRYILHRIVKLSTTQLSTSKLDDFFPYGSADRVLQDKELSTFNFQLTLQGDGNLQGYEHCSSEDILGTVIEIRSPKGHKKPLTKGRLWRLLKPLRKYLLKIYRHTYLPI